MNTFLWFWPSRSALQPSGLEQDAFCSVFARAGSCESVLVRPGSPRGPKRAQERPRAPQETPTRAPKVAPRAPEGALGTPRGAAGASKAPQRALREGQRAAQKGVGSDKIEPKAVAEAKKVDFVESAPRSSPLERQRFGPPQIGLKSVQSRPNSVPRASRAATSVDFGSSKVSRAPSASDSGRLGPPRARPGVAQGHSMPPCRARPFGHTLVLIGQFE